MEMKFVSTFALVVWFGLGMIRPNWLIHLQNMQTFFWYADPEKPEHRRCFRVYAGAIFIVGVTLIWLVG